MSTKSRDSEKMRDSKTREGRKGLTDEIVTALETAEVRTFVDETGPAAGENAYTSTNNRIFAAGSRAYKELAVTALCS